MKAVVAKLNAVAAAAFVPCSFRTIFAFWKIESMQMLSAPLSFSPPSCAEPVKAFWTPSASVISFSPSDA